MTVYSNSFSFEKLFCDVTLGWHSIMAVFLYHVTCRTIFMWVNVCVWVVCMSLDCIFFVLCKHKHCLFNLIFACLNIIETSITKWKCVCVMYIGVTLLAKSFLGILNFLLHKISQCKINLVYILFHYDVNLYILVTDSKVSQISFIPLQCVPVSYPCRMKAEWLVNISSRI